MSEAKYYKSVKTGVIAELVGKNEHGVILLLDNGEERVLATSTLKRWWTELSKAPQLEMLPETQKTDTEFAEDASSKFTGLHKQFITAINKFVETSGSELFFRETMGTYNLINDGTIYLWFKLTRNGVNVFVKSKAVGTDFAHTPLNHNFDMKIVFTSWDTKSYHTLRKLHDLSLKYQASKKKK
jgi:hypothetical protein